MIADTKINTYILKRGTTGNDLKQPKQLQQPRNNLRVPQFHRTPLLKKKINWGTSISQRSNR